MSETMRRSSDSDIVVKIATLEESVRGLITSIAENRKETSQIWQSVHELSGAVQKQNESYLRSRKPEWRTLIAGIGLLLAVLVPVTMFLINQNVTLNTTTQQVVTLDKRIGDVSTLTDNVFKSLDASLESLRNRQMAITDLVNQSSDRAKDQNNITAARLQDLNIAHNMAQDETDRLLIMLWKKVYSEDLPPRNYHANP